MATNNLQVGLDEIDHELLRLLSTTLMGEGLIEGSRAIHADVLLCGAHAVTAGVVSETSPEVAAVKRALMKAASTRRCPSVHFASGM